MLLLTPLTPYWTLSYKKMPSIPAEIKNNIENEDTRSENNTTIKKEKILSK